MPPLDGRDRMTVHKRVEVVAAGRVLRPDEEETYMKLYCRVAEGGLLLSPSQMLRLGGELGEGDVLVVEDSRNAGRGFHQHNDHELDLEATLLFSYQLPMVHVHPATGMLCP